LHLGQSLLACDFVTGGIGCTRTRHGLIDSVKRGVVTWSDRPARVASAASVVNDPKRTQAGSKSRAARSAVAAGSIGVSVHVNEKKSTRRS
jgi:hypothetical protein